MADRRPSRRGRPRSTGGEGEIKPQHAALGARLREARERLALTQDELATQVGRKKNWLSDIERGRRGIDVHTLQRIATITGRSVEYFSNPDYDQQRRQMLPRPATREDWELVYAGEPDRAAAHASLDEAFARARRLIESAEDGAAADS